MSNRHIMPLLALTAATILCLAPFANKAFHIDDEPFLWIARQIHAHPLDPYGFDSNWYGRLVPTHEHVNNPPLNAYYIALVTSLFGWSELTLHIAFLLPAIVAILGTYFLASDLCSRPLAASLVTLLTPAFFVSSTTVMCDTMMLAFWIWTVALWIRGFKHDDIRLLLASALLLSIATLIKYTAINLIPLLIAYSLAEKRKGVTPPICHTVTPMPAMWQSGRVTPLLLPLLILAIYQVITRSMYGHGLLFNAVSFSNHARQAQASDSFLKTLTGFSFAGGCLLPTLFYAPLLWNRRTILLGATSAASFLLSSALIHDGYNLFSINIFGMGALHPIKWGLLVQFVIFSTAGIHILALAIMDFLRRKDSSSVLLSLWVLGTFVFSTYLNWAINARSFLPMIPATAILVMRRMELREKISPSHNIYPSHNNHNNIDKALGPLAPAAIIALLVASADYSMAAGARNAAFAIHKQYSGQQIWFQGHWGFQYYMESFGAKAFDPKRSQLDKGALMIIPSNNATFIRMPEDSARLIETFSVHPFPFLATMDPSLGAGFYYHAWGPLPFALGPTEPDKYFVYRYQP